MCWIRKFEKNQKKCCPYIDTLVLGLPLLFAPDKKALIVVVCVLGTIGWAIGMVLVYELVIMKKYRVRRK